MNRIVLGMTVVFALGFYSCGKTCSRERSTLEHVDLSSLSPHGTFKGSNYTLTFNADSTATLRYTYNNNNYEINYKVKTHGKHDITQIKY